MRIHVPPLATLVAPGSAALMLIDVQQHFADEPFVFGLPEALANMKRLVRAATQAGVRRIFVRAVESDATNTPVWISRHVSKPHRLGKYEDGTPGADFHHELRPANGDIAITKTRYSAFYGTGLESQLHDLGITSLVIAGIATNVCVSVTACEAFQRDYWTLVVSDATTTRTPAEQDQALQQISTNWGQVVRTDEVVAAWNHPHATDGANLSDGFKVDSRG